MGLRCYVAGPMTIGNRITNARAAIDIAHRLLLRGHYPFVPHLHELWDLVYHEDYEKWMELDFAFIRVCDVLVRIPGDSAGADREVALAYRIRIPVFMGLEEFMASSYWTLEEMPKLGTID